MQPSGRILYILVSSLLVLGTLQGGCAGEGVRAETAPPAAAAPLPAPALPPAAAPPPAPAPQQPTDELQQLVAPIALYPDALVAQILAAATSPTQIVEADRWLQQHPELKGDALAKAVDLEPWDPAVKALTQFPGLLGMMDKNLSWTSSLGETYVDAQQDVFAAIQVMRERARQAGNLKSTPQESVTNDGNSIVIEPADPQVVYVPEYDPWLVYGDPLGYDPDWIGVPGFYYDGPGIWFGAGIGIGFFGGFGWGWNHWGTDWHRHDLIHGDHPYVPHSREFGNHNGFDGGHAGFDGGHAGFGGGRTSFGNSFDHAGAGWGTHGGVASGMHSGAFSGFSHGGEARTFSSRGRASFGGGFHGGGGHR